MATDEPTRTKPQDEQAQAAQHVAEAHSRLQELRERLERHPELDEAIERLEMALSILTVKTGGLL